MPQGGFGNLIALPLQHGPRAEGNTVFVDPGLHPFPDQWAYLASLQRIPASGVERVAADALRGGQMLGVRTTGVEEEDSAAPWLLPPSRRPPPMTPVVDEPVPTRRRSHLGATAVHQEGRSARFRNQRAQTPCRLPESGVPSETAPATLHGPDAAHHQLRRRLSRTRCAAARVHGRGGRFAPSLGSDARDR